MTDDQQHALQEQRRREADAVEMRGLCIRIAEAEAKELQAEAELAALREHAERARWCEEKQADVIYSSIEELWWVQWFDEKGMFCEVSDPDRDAAIDRARGK